MLKVYIGTYTKKDSKGIYTVQFDANTGTLSDLTLLIECKNPTFLDTHRPSNRLFSVSDQDQGGGIAIYDLNTTPPQLISQHHEPGSPPCYVHYDESTDTIFDANYHRGIVHAYINDTLDKTIQYDKGSHAHFVRSHPVTHDVYVCDLGLDAVRKYRLLNEIATYNTPQGSGPRHIEFHPTQPIIYVFCELSSEIIVLKDMEFEFDHLQTVSTLPHNEPVSSSGAAIRISKDGHYVYASNRGHDSIAVFKVNPDMTLTLIQTISSGGQHPRDFDITPDQNYLLVANRDSNNLAVLRRDTVSGLLESVADDFKVPEAVCVHFMR